jgi:PAS domain S-box-containing protein
VGHRVVNFMTPESAHIFYATFPRFLETGRVRNLELDFFCKDGSICTVLIDADLVAGAPGEPPVTHSTLVDISEHKRSAQRLELALTAADLGLWDVEYSSGNVYLSARACSILGYPEGGLFPHISDLEKWVHPDDAPTRRAAINAMKNGNAPYYRADYRVRHKQGHWVWVRANGRMVARDEKSNPLRAVGTLQDISQEKRLQLESGDLLQRIESLIHAIGKVPQAPPPPAPVAPAIAIGIREQQVIQLIAAGCTCAEIGEQLGISASTAATHRRNVMRKLDLHSTAELTRYALAHKLISS